MKTILITGSTDGIGKLAAQQLAAKGHSVIIHGRNTEKIHKTVTEIKEATNNKHISGVTADLSQFHQIENISQHVAQSNLKIDVLINNAGVFKSTEVTNGNGLELRYAVNYFAPYLLTHQLIHLMSTDADRRIINLSSAAQESVSIAALHGKQPLSAQSAYAQSKLALTMWTFHMARQHPDIAITALNPGSLLNTRMVQEAYGRYWSPASKGADIIASLAVDEEFNGETEKYFDNDLGDPRGNFGPAHADAYDQVKIDELLAQTEQIISTLN